MNPSYLIKKNGLSRAFGIISIRRFMIKPQKYLIKPRQSQPIYNVIVAVSKRTNMSGSTSSSNKPITIQALSLFGAQNPKYESEFKKLESVYGFCNKNNKNEGKDKTICQVYKQFVKLLNQGNNMEIQFGDNKIKDILMKLFQANDQSIVIMMLDLFIKILQNRSISPIILKFCGLSIHQKVIDPYNNVMLSSLSNICLQIIMSQPHIFKLQTIRCAVQLIEIINPRILNIKLQNYVQTTNFETQKIVFECFRKMIEKINSIITTNLNESERILEILQKSEVQMSKTFLKDLKTYGLIEKQQNKKIKIDSIQFIEKLFSIFFLIRNLRYRILNSKYQNQDIERLLSSDKKTNSISNTYQVGCEVVVDQKYCINNCFFKELGSEQYQFCYLLLCDSHIILIERILKNTKNNEGVVILNQNLKNLMWIIDRSDPRKLLLSTNFEAKTQSISLLFIDSKALFCTKSQLEILKKEIVRTQITEFLKKLEYYGQDIKK